MNVRYGIMGPGGIAIKFAEALARTEDAVLYGVASRDLTRAKDFADKFGAEVAYGSYEELAKDENIDVIYISVVHAYHVPLAKMAIENGKAVICEKPLGINLKECKELFALAKEKNILLMEAMWTRFIPTYVLAKQWVAENRIGEIRMLTSAKSYNKSGNDLDALIYKQEMGGGGIFGVGCYALGIALDFGGGKPIITRGIAKMSETKVDEYAMALLMHENGLISNCKFGFKIDTVQDAVIYGDTGRIVMKDCWDCSRVELYNKKGELIEAVDNKEANGFIFEAAHMTELFKAGKKESDIMSLQHSLELMEVIEELRLGYLDDMVTLK